MPTGKVLEVGYADALPSEDRLSRFQRLAKLQLSRVASFNRYCESREFSTEEKNAAQEAWNACWESMRTQELFDLIRRLAVMDEGFRLPELKAGTPEFAGNVEEKFAKLMLAVSLLALEIQRDYEGGAEKETSCLQ